MERLLLDEVCVPLGMSSTGQTLSPDLFARAVQGHDLMGTPMPAWNFQPVLAGCGALQSTADDLLRFLRAQMDEATPAIRQTHVPRASSTMARWRIGLGWHVSGDGCVAWHDGGTYGSYSFVGFDKKSG